MSSEIRILSIAQTLSDKFIRYRHTMQGYTAADSRRNVEDSLIDCSLLDGFLYEDHGVLAMPLCSTSVKSFLNSYERLPIKMAQCIIKYLYVSDVAWLL